MALAWPARNQPEWAQQREGWVGIWEAQVPGHSLPQISGRAWAGHFCSRPCIFFLEKGGVNLKQCSPAFPHRGAQIMAVLLANSDEQSSSELSDCEPPTGCPASRGICIWAHVSPACSSLVGRPGLAIQDVARMLWDDEAAALGLCGAPPTSTHEYLAVCFPPPPSWWLSSRPHCPQGEPQGL